jgi:large subunit ribosomal protein L4
VPNVIDVTGNVVATRQAPASVGRDFGDKLDVIYRAVHRELANPRAGTASTKKRDEVTGGGRKPWRQKGTGRARQGSIRSPQWRHGGVVFGPQPRSYVEALNKKERRLAFVAALADRFKNDAVALFDVGDFAVEKTSAFAKTIFGSTKAARSGPTTLIVCRRGEPHAAQIERVARNLPRVAVTDDGSLDVKDVLRFERILFTTAAYDAVTSSLSDIGAPRGDSERGGAQPSLGGKVPQAKAKRQSDARSAELNSGSES